MTLILDVGCGHIPKGDINVDLYYDDTPHMKMKINPKNIKNFIISSGLYLPIRDKIFNVVYSSHVLEHIEIPPFFIIEQKRVSKKYVIIKIPNEPKVIEHKKHLYCWSKSSLGNLLELFFKNVKVYFYYTQFEAFKKRKIYRIIRLIFYLFPDRVIERVFINMILKSELLAICRD